MFDFALLYETDISNKGRERRLVYMQRYVSCYVQMLIARYLFQYVGLESVPQFTWFTLCITDH